MRATLFALRYKNRVFEFAAPLAVHIVEHDGVWHLKNKGQLAAEELAASPAKAILQLASTISFLWFAYAECSDTQLDAGARELKRTLLGHIKIGAVRRIK